MYGDGSGVMYKCAHTWHVMLYIHIENARIVLDMCITSALDRKRKQILGYF